MAPDPRSDYRRRCMARIAIRCRQMMLSRPDRLEIASTVLNLNVESFDQLSPQELSRVVDGFDFAYYVAALLQERHLGHRI